MPTMFHSEGSCPGEHLLAAYADQQLLGDERHEVEKHLVGCDKCLHLLASLVKGQGAAIERTPEDLLRAARRLGASPPPRTLGWRWLPVPLVALIAVVAFTTWRVHLTSEATVPQSTSAPSQVAKSSPPPAPNAATDDREVRGNANAALTIVSPKPGEQVSAGAVQFRWEPQPEAEYYDVQVMTEGGDLVWEARENSAVTALPRSVHLVSGQSYFLLVRAHVRHGVITESAPVQFRAG